MDNEPQPSSENQPNITSAPESQPAPMGETPPAQVIEQSQPAPEKPKKSKTGLLMAIILLLVAAAAGAFFLTKNKDTDKKATQTKKDIPVFSYASTYGEMGNLYPENSTSPFEVSINAQIYEGLVHYENLTKIVPGLAESWKNPDASTWVFTLKKGVKFHNGHTLTAKDVKYSLENIKSNENLGDTFASTIKEVTVSNDYEVKVTTDGPDPLLLNRLSFLYIVDSSAPWKADDANGTGPYTVKPNTEITATEAKLAAFDGYHGGHVGVREIDYSVYESEDKLIEDINSGKIDMANDLSKESQAKINKTVASPTFTKTIYVDHIRVDHNNAGSPVQKLGVRKAMWESIDAKALLESQGLEGDVASQIVPNGIPGYDTSIKAPARSVEKAKADLKEAGYPNGVTITLSYYSPLSDTLAEALQKQMKDSGITLKLDPQTDVKKLVAMRGNHQTELTLNAASTDLFDVTDTAANIFTGNNLYTNPKLDSLITEANKTIDPGKHLVLTKQISRTLMDDVAWVPLYTSSINSAFTKKNYVITPDWYADLGVYFWKGYSQ